MLQQEKPEDFVLATGTTTSIRDFLIKAFSEVNVIVEFKGAGVNEVGIVKETNNTRYAFMLGQEVIKIDPKYFRPTEVDLLIGDPTKAKEKLGWEPIYTLDTLIKEMMASDLKLFEKDKYLLQGGHEILKQAE